MKFCRDCRWARETSLGPEHAYCGNLACARRPVLDVVSGKTVVIERLCWSARNLRGPRGPDGNLWQPKDDEAPANVGFV
jgi:hypothetical protein